MQDCGAGVLGIKREQPVKQRQDAVRRGKLPQANSARSLSQDRLFSRRKGEVLSHHFPKVTTANVWTYLLFQNFAIPHEEVTSLSFPCRVW